jgi:glycosyltransferase involved in cell wall biosynthesis
VNAVSEPVVSIIVPVRNDRGRHLQALLDALSRQSMPREEFEIVIGDDGSTDGSTDALETSDGHVRVARGPAQNSYAGRNRAAQVARGSVLAFCDSDCVPEPDWLTEGLRALNVGGPNVIVAGRVRFVVPAHPTVWSHLDMDSTKDHERAIENGNAETCNLFVHRSLYDRLNGFDDSIPEHGDFDFASRAVAEQGRLVFCRDAVVWHPTRDSAKPFLRMVWIMHRWYAARATRDGAKPIALQIRWWVPFLAHGVWRRRSGRSLGLDSRWFLENGVTVQLRDNLRAVPIMYLFLPYYGGIAQLRGYIDGRRLRRSARKEATAARPDAVGRA